MSVAGETVFLAVTMRLYTKHFNRWSDRCADLIALAPAAGTAASQPEVLAEAKEEKIIRWNAMPLPLDKEWAESIHANLTSPQPRLFLVYRIENDTILPTLTVAGDEAAGYGEVDNSVLAMPLPTWLLPLLQTFVTRHYKPQPKKVRKRQ